MLMKSNVSKKHSKRERTKQDTSFEGERIAKVLSRAGVCSRREAERMIIDGRVAVDGSVLTSPAFNVTDENKITVDGKLISPFEETRVWRYYKPRGTITSERDPHGRPTVFSDLPDSMPRVISVGRLDFNTEGLLLLTNDGELARYLELPSNAWMRRYLVRVSGHVGKRKLDSVANGVTIDGVRYGPVKIELERSESGNHWLSVSICEGKNREVRNIMSHLGLKVSRLIRVEYGPFSLGKLRKSSVVEVSPRVLKNLLRKYFDDKSH
ncbi:MAG: rRNA pseudouridine synthase [Euryarchaeota archaeon]|nr:rRNA pseudouridine synthase [Euryarchaeota archaeon]